MVKHLKKQAGYTLLDKERQLMNLNIKHIVFAGLLAFSSMGIAQQDPQYTQYTYNPITVNSGYTGSRGHLALLSLYRSQWTGIEGSPQTITFSLDTPINEFNGFGLSIIQDELGPASETYIDGNYSHHLLLNRNGDKLALGLKAGMRFFSIDWTKGIHKDPDVAFNENINGKLLPTIGAGAFYYSQRAYLGLSVPNFFSNDRYDELKDAKTTERMHFFLIGGYVFDLNPDLKFKPSFFGKYVAGSPLSVDVSANFLLYETLNLGVNYRWDDSLSAILGFQVSSRINLGYAYDFTTSKLSNYNSGTHELFFRYQLISKTTKIKSPRFF